MKISILDVQHAVFEGVVSEAILPGADGELTILDDHEPIFVALGRGHIYLMALGRGRGFGFVPFGRTVSGGIKPIKILCGVARMRKNMLVILVELDVEKFLTGWVLPKETS